jgi:hypothetical protein
MHYLVDGSDHLCHMLFAAAAAIDEGVAVAIMTIESIVMQPANIIYTCACVLLPTLPPSSLPPSGLDLTLI